MPGFVVDHNVFFAVKQEKTEAKELCDLFRAGPYVIVFSRQTFTEFFQKLQDFKSEYILSWYRVMFDEGCLIEVENPFRANQLRAHLAKSQPEKRKAGDHWDEVFEDLPFLELAVSEDCAGIVFSYDQAFVEHLKVFGQHIDEELLEAFWILMPQSFEYLSHVTSGEAPLENEQIRARVGR